jgi:hypothetical protein
MSPPFSADSLTSVVNSGLEVICKVGKVKGSLHLRDKRASNHPVMVILAFIQFPFHLMILKYVLFTHLGKRVKYVPLTHKISCYPRNHKAARSIVNNMAG